MANVNYSIQEKAQVALSIIFILSIAAANCLLVISIVRQRRAILVVRSTILLSLAVGDVILALFSLVIDLLGEERFQCNTPFFSKIYRDYLLQFVYSAGLLMLALYLMMTYRAYQHRQAQHQQQQHHEQQRLMGIPNDVESGSLRVEGVEGNQRRGKTLRVGLALMCSGIPWLVALMVVLPLAAPRLNECNPYTGLSREIIYMWVCVVLPSTLALVAAGSTAAILKPTQSQSSSLGPRYAPVITELGDVAPPHTNLDSGGLLQMGSSPGIDGGGGDHGATCRYGGPDVSKHAHQSQHRAESTLYPNAVYSPQYPPTNTWAESPRELPPTGSWSEGNVSTSQIAAPLEPPTFDPRPTLNFEREKTALLAVAIVHFVCVLPNAVFALTFANYPHLHDEVDFLTFAVLSEVCKWLAVLRSVLAPLCWITLLRS
ncbi:hypothetical protein PoB_007294300 [Plakobranchus ocellatus]|uniref:G-protein coupled receptors family 1 profile domain-containing protein n=1 Tax=Plakobranchus ocellatus TaxID=259542 RepID=A0AAV4DQ31_9GAST|nr:hypothetical protein PoB_007294300 [Plakobranchus ocellatus]